MLVAIGRRSGWPRRRRRAAPRARDGLRDRRRGLRAGRRGRRRRDGRLERRRLAGRQAVAADPCRAVAERGDHRVGVAGARERDDSRRLLGQRGPHGVEQRGALGRRPAGGEVPGERGRAERDPGDGLGDSALGRPLPRRCRNILDIDPVAGERPADDDPPAVMALDEREVAGPGRAARRGAADVAERPLGAVGAGEGEDGQVAGGRGGIAGSGRSGDARRAGRRRFVGRCRAGAGAAAARRRRAGGRAASRPGTRRRRARAAPTRGTRGTRPRCSPTRRRSCSRSRTAPGRRPVPRWWRPRRRRRPAASVGARRSCRACPQRGRSRGRPHHPVRRMRPSGLAARLEP